MQTATYLPQLPIISLHTADEIMTRDIGSGRKTIIDFWTTKCVQCPAALDKLNQLATDYPEVQFVSICCDSLDGAREILQRHDAPRWDAVHHFFMNKADKERAKKLLGFASVPFYVVLDEEGGMVEKGNKIDLLEHVMNKENLDFVQVTPEDATEERELVFDELDF